MKVKLTFPSGEDVVIDHADAVDDLLSHPHKYFLPEGCGEAALDYFCDGRSAMLAVRHIENVGFSTEWCEKTINQLSYGQSYISCGEIPTYEVLTTSVGGMEMKLPANSFHDRFQTLETIQYFISTGLRSPNVSWTPTEELPKDVYGQ